MDLPSKSKQRRASLESKLWDAYVLQSRERHQQDRANRLRIWGQQGGQQGTCKRWRDNRIEAHLELVRKAARTLKGKYFWRVPLEDLIGAGYLGLVKAADRLHPEDQEKFEHYAWPVVCGHIMDAHKRRFAREERHESIDEWQEPKDDGSRANSKAGHWLRDWRPLPDELAIQGDTERKMQMLIDELPHVMAEVIRAAMDGVPVTEIARQCGRSPAWVRARLAEAKNRIGAGIILL